ncbi:VasL domain-containing protein [Pantoea sp.]|uniref:VasL domain-containing protein n=1 Tax=Pantoea sp. TaxID=69393 RepID=UPI00289D0FF8|nr:VasL domain-containing protein [Pantoea sp.]
MTINAATHRIQAGTDPCTLTEYLLLCDEIGKLNHPARPGVDWAYVEKLCLRLFELNGVELQSTAWYTLARTEIAQVSGLNEGLRILETLVLRHWSALWPSAMQARTEIINVLSRRLQSMLRSGAFQQHSELTALMQTEKLLLSLRNALTDCDLRDAGQIGILHQQVRYLLSRLQESASLPVSVVSTAAAVTPSPATENAALKANVIQSSPEAQTPVGQMPAPPSFFKPFVIGACCTLLAGSLALCGAFLVWQQQQREQRQIQQEQEQLRIVKEAISLDRLENWHQGMAQLQQLTSRLNALDEKNGKYMTVSELKSAVFSATQAFNRHIPVEEQLRRYASEKNHQLFELTQTGMLLKQLNYRYELLEQEKSLDGMGKTKKSNPGK